MTMEATLNQRIRAAEGLRLGQEALALGDIACLYASPVIWGFGVPHGHGEPVIVVPGFLGSDIYLQTMHRWLRRVGYRTYNSAIGRNYDCPDLLVERLMLTIEQAHLETKQKVALIGHSLGGTLSRVVSSRLPDQIAQVITLGSPLQSANVHPFVLAAKEVVRRRIHRGEARRPECYTDSCQCGFAARAMAGPPERVPRHAIYTRGDNVVHWESCIEDDASLNIEVRSTHLGLAFNASVYREIAKLLAAL